MSPFLPAALWLAASIPLAPVTVTDLAGKAQEGEIESLEKGKLRLRSGEEVREIPVEEIRTVAFPATGPAKPDPALFLTDGSALAGEIGAVSKERLALKSDSLGPREFPLSAVRAIRFPKATTDADLVAAFRRERAAGREAVDRIFVIRGDSYLTISATILSIGTDEIAVRWEGSERSLDRSKTYGIVFGRSAAPAPPPADAARIELADGGAILAPISSWTKERLVAAVAGGGVEVPAGSIVRVEFAPGRMAYLSDLEPAESAHTPFLKGASGYAVAWPFRKDRNARGGEMKLRGKRYGKGLGVHSRTRLAYDLNGDYKTFYAVAGLDDEAGTRGHCVFRILGDGKPLVPEFSLRGGETPREISADVAGVRRLVLEVDYGEGFDLSDFADWADARVVK